MKYTSAVSALHGSAARNSGAYLLVVFGLVSAFGPFLTDFYLPALPALADWFDAPASLVQLSLTLSMAGLAAGQLVFGPLSDKYGRKAPLLGSMVLFVAATVACILSRSIETFLLCRLVQGFAGAGGVVISKSVASDLYEGPALTRFFVMLAAVQGLAPIFAPVLGGVLLEVTDWRGIFGVLAVLGVAMCCVLAGFRESLPAVRRSSDGVVATFGHYLPVVRNRPFLLCVAVQALAMGVMFTYIASSPFLFQQHYGISSLAYSMLFGVNAFAIMLGSFAVTRFRRPAAALLAGARGFLAVCLLAALALVTDAPVWCVEAALFALLFCLGLVLPTSTSLALEFERANSGSASALIGCSAFLVGGIVSPLTGIGPMQTMTAVLMVLCAAGTLLCARRIPGCRR